MTVHGGNRKGAGRPKGSRNKVDGETLTAVRDAAQKHGQKALDKIVSLMDSDSDKVALAAANGILDRAYGKPQQHMDHTSDGGGLQVVIQRFSDDTDNSA